MITTHVRLDSLLRADVAPPPPDHAPSPSEGSEADGRATQFQAVEGGGETHSGEGLMVAAYSVLWVILMGYLIFVWRKQAALTARMDDLDRVLDKAAIKAKAKAQA